MKRVRAILIGVATVAAVAAAMLIFGDREPSYQGRKLSEWADDGFAAVLESPGNYQDSPKWQVASQAVQQMGDETIPWLTKWFRTEFSQPKAQIISWLNGNRLHRFHFTTDVQQRIRGYYGFMLLGAKSKAMWPVFIALTYEKKPGRRMMGLQLLWRCHADNETMLPVLRRLATDPDVEVALGAAKLLEEDYAPESSAKSTLSVLQPDWKKLSNMNGTNSSAVK